MRKHDRIAVTVSLLLIVSTGAAAAPAGAQPPADHIVQEPASHYEAGGVLHALGSGQVAGAIFFCQSIAPTETSLTYVDNTTGPDEIRFTYAIPPCGLSATCTLTEVGDGAFKGPCRAPWLEEGEARISELQRHDIVKPTVPEEVQRIVDRLDPSAERAGGPYLPASAQDVSFDLTVAGDLTDTVNDPPSVPEDRLDYRYVAFGEFQGVGIDPDIPAPQSP